MVGSVENQHNSRPMKQFSLELRQKLLYSCGDAKRAEYEVLLLKRNCFLTVAA